MKDLPQYYQVKFKAYDPVANKHISFDEVIQAPTAEDAAKVALRAKLGSDTDVELDSERGYIYAENTETDEYLEIDSEDYNDLAQPVPYERRLELAGVVGLFDEQDDYNDTVANFLVGTGR